MVHRIFLTPAIFLIILRYTHSYRKPNVGRLHSQYRIYSTYEGMEFNNCRHGRKLCRLDLKGYYVGCDEGTYHACPTGTRCGCHAAGVCEIKNPCISVDKPYPMLGKGTFRFIGSAKWSKWVCSWDEGADCADTKIPRVFGVVKQDASAGKYLQVISHEGYAIKSKKSFELIVPNEQGSFTKYVGFSTRDCQKTTIKEFEPFGVDISNYLLTDTQKKNDEETQTWQYRANDDIGHTTVSWTWKWVISSDERTKTSLPITTEYTCDGGGSGGSFFCVNYDNRYEEEQTIRWETDELESDWSKEEEWYTDFWDEKGDWFRIPDFCMQ